MRITPLLDDEGHSSPHGSGSITKRELGFHVRRHVRANLYDESAVSASSLAIYALCDPRNIRDVRYIGQTKAPQRRFLQHLNDSRLWLPDELPWWIKSPRLRPLYSWIRHLYSDDRRLPVMLIRAWVATSKDARLAERAHIVECLTIGHELYNVEKDRFGAQMPLV